MEIGKYLFFGDLGSQKGIDLIRVKRHPHRLLDSCIHIHHAVHHLAGSQLFDQLAGPVNGSLSVVGIQSLLELAGSIRAQADLLG